MKLESPRIAGAVAQYQAATTQAVISDPAYTAISDLANSWWPASPCRQFQTNAAGRRMAAVMIVVDEELDNLEQHERHTRIGDQHAPDTPVSQLLRQALHD